MKFVFEGIPIAKMRHRDVNFCGSMIKYDPQHRIKEEIKKKMLVQFNQASKSEAESLRSAEGLHVSFVFALPACKTDPLIKKNGKLWNFESPAKKPDIDNLEKFYLDCGNGVLFSDDSKIISLYSTKVYSQIPRTEMIVMKKKSTSLSEESKKIICNFSPQEITEMLDDFREIFYKSVEELDVFSKEIWGDLGEGRKKLIEEASDQFLEEMAYFLLNFAKKYGNQIAKIKKICQDDKK